MQLVWQKIVLLPEHHLEIAKQTNKQNLKQQRLQKQTQKLNATSLLTFWMFLDKLFKKGKERKETLEKEEVGLVA